MKSIINNPNHVNHSSVRNTAEKKPRSSRRTRMAENAVRSQEEVAKVMGLSRQRVQDIEKRAFKKLRHAFVEQMPSLEFERDERGAG